MSEVCVLCRRCFNPPKDWTKHICPRCIKEKNETEQQRKIEAERIKVEAEKEQDRLNEIGPFVVVFLGVDGPHEISEEFERMGQAEEFVDKIHKGINENYAYLKGSDRLRIFKTEYRRSDEPIIIPVGSLDGIRAEDFDPSKYR